MGTQGNTPAPEALGTSPQLAAEALEIEAKPNPALVIPVPETTDTLESPVMADGLDSHQREMHETLVRVIDLAGQYLISKNKYNNVRLEYGRELRKLQALHARPGCGTFVERLKALRSKMKISQSTAYALIAKSEIADGLRPKPDKKPTPKSAASLSKSWKDERNGREQKLTSVANPLAHEVQEASPIPEGVEHDDTDTLVQLHIPANALKKWDDAIVTLRGRPGYKSADLSELVIESVTAYADIMRLHQVQAHEDAEEHPQTGKPSSAFVAVAPAPILKNAIQPEPVPLAIAPPTPRPPLAFAADEEEVR